MLFLWHQAPKTKGAKKGDKRQKWQQILADAMQPPEYARWLDKDEERFVALNATNIDISNSHYGCEEALKKRELEAAANHFCREVRDKLQKEWDTMKGEDAEEAITSLQEKLLEEVTESTDGEHAAV